MSEIVVMIDFSENYSIVVQNEVQNFQLKKRQVTLQPIAITVKQFLLNFYIKNIYYFSVGCFVQYYNKTNLY